MTWQLLRTWTDPEMQRKALWVADMMEAAKGSADVIGVSCQAVVGQAALETGWGRSLIGTHNLYGIKATPDWKGLRVQAPTFEVVNGQRVFIIDTFRDYATFAESIADHLAFLEQNSRYRAAGVFDRKGDRAYFEALQHGGYATDPDYAVHLIAMRDTIDGYFLRYMTEDGAAPAVIDTEPTRVAAHRWLTMGASGTDVLELQGRLTKGGWNTNGVDGWFGAGTRGAVMRFQNDNHLPDVDGIVGDQTWAAVDKLAA
jgi:hypothetical protein